MLFSANGGRHWAKLSFSGPGAKTVPGTLVLTGPRSVWAYGPPGILWHTRTVAAPGPQSAFSYPWRPDSTTLVQGPGGAIGMTGVALDRQARCRRVPCISASSANCGASRPSLTIGPGTRHNN